MRTSMSAKMATCSGCSSHSARYGCWQWLCASSMEWARCASAHSLSVVLSLKRDSHRWHHRVCHACHRIELCRCLVRWSIDKEALPATTRHTLLVLGAGSGATETAWLNDMGPCGHRAHEMWALFRSHPLDLFMQTRNADPVCSTWDHH